MTIEMLLRNKLLFHFFIFQRLEISRSDIQEGGVYGTTQERNLQAPPYEGKHEIRIPHTQK